MEYYTVTFAAEAENHLSELYHYIAEAANPTIAKEYTDKIVTYCHTLEIFPHRGQNRNDLQPGLRVTHYRRRTVILFLVEKREVIVTGIYHVGRNYEADFMENS